MLIVKIKQSSIDLLLLVLVTTILSYFNTAIFPVIKYSVVVYLFPVIKYSIVVYLVVKYHKEFKKARMIYILLLVYSVLLGVSSYINYDSVTRGIYGFMHGIRLISIMVALSGITEKRGVRGTVSVLITILFVFLIVTDILIIAYPYNIDSSTLYLVGDKFHVSYMHCMLMALISLAYKNLKKIYIMVFYVICLLVTIRIKCTTGMLMLAFMFAIELVTDVITRFRTFICNINLAVILMAVENVLIWGSVAILYTPWATHIIVDILGKSSNMTGRFQLYNVIPELIMNKPILGYGLQSDIFRDMFGYGNAQNGLMQVVIESGILGASIFFVSLYFAGTKANRNPNLYPIYLYVLSFIIGSISEMNISTHFVFGMALLFAFGMHSKMQEDHDKQKETNRMRNLLVRN